MIKKSTNHKTHTDVILDSIADGVFTVDMDFKITEKEVKKWQQAILR